MKSGIKAYHLGNLIGPGKQPFNFTEVISKLSEGTGEITLKKEKMYLKTKSQHPSILIYELVIKL